MNKSNIEKLNTLGEDFPKVNSIISTESDLGGTLETLYLDSGGEIEFYLTESDKDNYLAKIISYYSLSQLVHIVEGFNKVTHNIYLDRSTSLIEIVNSTYKLVDLIPSRSKYSDPAWDTFKSVIKTMKSNLNKLGYTEFE